MKRLLCGLMVLGLLSGCAQVQPWERGILAKKAMAFDPDPSERAFRNHVYFSKEASNGSASAGGGGCGCN